MQSIDNFKFALVLVKRFLSSCKSFEYVSGNPFITFWIADKLLIIIDAFALTSSIASGFFFCGIIDELDNTSSPRLIKFIKSDDHKIISSANRDM